MPIVTLDQLEDLSGLVPLWEFETEGYRYVLYSGNRVQVFKGAAKSATYIVDEHGCSCRAAQYGNPDCKHRVMFTWIGDGANNNEITERGIDSGSSAIDSLL